MHVTFAHHSLVQKGVAFAHRPPPLDTSHALGNNVHTINMAAYGPLWRLLRRPLLSDVFHPSHLSLQADARAWALHGLVGELICQAEACGRVVQPTEIFQFSIFRLFSLLYFGLKLDEETLRSIRDTQVGMIKLAVNLSVFNLLPKIVLVFLRRWKKLLHVRQRLDDLIVPLIQARQSKHDVAVVKLSSYVDSLLELVEQGGRRLSEGEMVSLCSMFLNANIETTSMALEWIMANLVKHQAIQEKLSVEIESVMGATQKAMVEEEKVVVVEGLRRHPPAHFLLPHTVTKDTGLKGYIIPRGATVNMVEVGWDDGVWTEPRELRWEGMVGEEVDLSKQPGLTVGMKNPFRAHIVARTS